MFFCTIDKAHENNKGNGLSTNNLILARFIRNGYAAKQLTTIARLLDGRYDSISLVRIIKEFKSRLEIENMEIPKSDPIKKENSLNRNKLKKLLRKLETNESLKKIKTDRHKIIAHMDESHFENPLLSEIKDIENALVVLAYVARELSYMVSQTIETFSYYPELALNDIFKNLDKPFFFPSEIDNLTKHFLDLQNKMDENIKAFSS